MTHSFKIKYGNINAITTCKIFTAKNIYKHLKINAKNLPWIQSFTDIYIFSHHCDLGKRFHDNKHVYSKKRTLNNWLNFPKMHPRIHQYNTLMGTEYINAPHVTFSLPEISPQIWKLFLKTFSECKVSLIYFVIIAILGNAFITAITT